MDRDSNKNQISRPEKILVAAATTLLVTGLVWSVRHQDAPAAISSQTSSVRGPASHNVDPSKRERELEKKPSPQGKAGAGHSIKIEAKNGQGVPISLPADGDFSKYDLINSRFTLTATIAANRHMAAHDFSWIFPQTYKVISGTSVGVVPELQPGQTHQIELSLDRGSEPEQPIVLHVYKLVNSEPRGTVVQFDFPREVKKQTSKSSKIDLSNEDFVQ